MDYYWECGVEDLRRRTSLGDLGAANALARRLLDEPFTTELIVTTIAQLVAKPDHSVQEPHWQVEFDEDHVFVGSYA